MSKVFISTLGTTKYEECVYQFNANDRSGKTFFIQEASIRYFCKDWDKSKGDRIKILCTDTALVKNWRDNGHKDYKTGEAIKRAGLGSILNKLLQEDPFITKLDIETIPVLIPEGKNSGEIWQIFEALYQQIENNDEVWFDITHAYRSIPMLVLVCIIYARVLKNITVKSITYGAYDARENNVAPVFDLTRFIALMDWTNAAKDFSEYGQTKQLLNLLTSDINPLLKESKGTHLEAKFSKAIGKGIEELSESIIQNKLSQVVLFSSLKKNLAEYRAVAPSEMKAFIPIVEIINKKIEPFNENDLGNVFAATRWCTKHGMYQNAYSILLEGCISIALDAVGENWQPIAKNNADKGIVEIKRKIPIAVAKLQTRTIQKVKDDLSSYTDIIDKMRKIMNVQVAEIFEKLNSYRNSFMHCGTGTNEFPDNTLKEIDFFCEKLEFWYVNNCRKTS
jgi:CRISPR-associated Csx2 family protein